MTEPMLLAVENMAYESGYNYGYQDGSTGQKEPLFTLEDKEAILDQLNSHMFTIGGKYLDKSYVILETIEWLIRNKMIYGC